MKLHLKVTEAGKEPYEVTTNLVTLVAWERRFKRKASDMANKLDAVEVVAEEIENPTHAELTEGS